NEARLDKCDCVMRTRSGRNALALTDDGEGKIHHAVHKRDPAPLESGCPCYACRHFSRAYLHHLFLAQEMLGPTLLSLHNVAYYCRLMEGVRQAIREGQLGEFRAARLVRRGDSP